MSSLSLRSGDSINVTVKANYHYRALQTSTSFRILSLLPGEPDDEICIKLHNADWDKLPSYEAISYAWGNPNAKVQIRCDDSFLEVTPNLLDGLRQMRYRQASRYLWADAICINQEDIPERGHQVSNMLKIYQNASRLLVWLGVDELGHAKLASETINELTTDRKSVV